MLTIAVLSILITAPLGDVLVALTGTKLLEIEKVNKDDEGQTIQVISHL